MKKVKITCAAIKLIPYFKWPPCSIQMYSTTLLASFFFIFSSFSGSSLSFFTSTPANMYKRVGKWTSRNQTFIYFINEMAVWNQILPNYIPKSFRTPVIFFFSSSFLASFSPPLIPSIILLSLSSSITNQKILGR